MDTSAAQTEPKHDATRSGMVALFALATLCALSTYYSVMLWRHANFSSVYNIATPCIIAFMLRARARQWRWAGLVAGLTGSFIGAIASDLPPLQALAYGVASALEIVVAYALTKLAWKHTTHARQVPELFAFVACAGLVAPLVFATFASFISVAGGYASYWTAFERACTSHLTGAIVVGIFALTITRADMREVFGSKPLRSSLILGYLFLVTLATFIQNSYPLLFMIFPMLTLTTFRLRFGGAALATIIVSVTSTIMTVFQHGPITLVHGDNIEIHIHFLQLFLCVVVLTTLPFSMLLRDRDVLKKKTLEDRSRIFEGEELYRQIEQHSPIGLSLSSLDGRWLRVNPAIVKRLGYERADELLNRPIADCTHPEDISASDWYRGEILRGAIPSYQLEKRYLHRDGTPLWFVISVSLVHDADGKALYFVAQMTDVNESKMAELSLREAKHNAELAYSIQHAESQRRQFINSAGRLMQNPTDIHATLDRVARHAVTRLGDVCLIIFFSEHVEQSMSVTGLATNASLAIDEHAARQIRRKSQRELIDIFGLQPLIEQQRSIYNVVTTSQFFAANLNISAVPIFNNQQVAGIVVVGNETETIISDDNRQLLQELAGRLSIVIEVARLFERERRLAQELQQAMLPPTLPSLLEASIDAIYVPASSESDVGGDWYDAFTLPDGRIFISVGDVAGHGLAAAGAMGKIRQMIRAYALIDPSPVAIARQCDRAISFLELPTSTAIFGVYDTVLGSFVFVQAGHPSPILIEPDGKVTMLTDAARTLPLGLIDDCPIDEAAITINPGARFIAYTDGLIEYERDVIIGEARLLQAVEQLAQGRFDNHPAHAVVAAVFGEQTPRDDVAMLVLTAPAPSRASLNLNAKATPLNLRILRQRISSFAAQRGLHGSGLQRLEIAVGEALTNVFEHAYHFESGEIMIFGSGTEFSVSIEIADHGRWRRERDEGRGYGISVMKEFCDQVEVFHDNLGTRVRLTQGVEA